MQRRRKDELPFLFHLDELHQVLSRPRTRTFAGKDEPRQGTGTANKKQIEKNLFESADHFFGEWFGRMGWIHKVRVLGCTAGSSGVSVLLTLVDSGCQRKFRCRLAASGSERMDKYVERD